MDRLHRAGNGGHQGRDRNIHRLSHLQVARIGVAVILLQPQTGIVGEDRHLLALGDGITGIQRHGLHQLAGIAGGEIQSCDVFLGLGELFLIALHIAPGLLHGGLCRRRVDGEQRRAGSHRLTFRHQHIHHCADSGDGDCLTVLGLGQAAALDRGGDGTVLHNVGDHLSLIAALAAQHFQQHHRSDHQQQCQYAQADDPAPLLPRDRLPPGLQVYARLRGGGAVRRRLLHRRSGRFLFYILQVFDFSHGMYSSSCSSQMHQLYCL